MSCWKIQKVVRSSPIGASELLIQSREANLSYRSGELYLEVGVLGVIMMLIELNH